MLLTTTQLAPRKTLSFIATGPTTTAPAEIVTLLPMSGLTLRLYTISSVFAPIVTFWKIVQFSPIEFAPITILIGCGKKSPPPMEHRGEISTLNNKKLINEKKFRK